MTIDHDLSRAQASSQDSVTLSVELRVTPGEGLKQGLTGQNGVLDLTEAEAVASAVTLAVVDAPFEDHEVPLHAVQVTLEDVTVTSDGRHPSP